MPAPVNPLKGVPARAPRSQYPGPANPARINGHFWPPSYPAASRAGAPPPTIRQYIDQQQHPA